MLNLRLLTKLLNLPSTEGLTMKFWPGAKGRYGPVKKVLPAPPVERALPARILSRSALSHDGLHPAHSILAHVLVRDTGHLRERKTWSGAHPLGLPTAFVHDNVHFGKVLGRYARTRPNPGLGAAGWAGSGIPAPKTPRGPCLPLLDACPIPPTLSLRS